MVHPRAAARPAPRRPVVEAVDLSRTYRRDADEIRALDRVTLRVDQGEFVALMGPSGSGKSTLLNIIAGIDRPTGGTIRVAGEDLSALDEDELAAWRNARLGFVFQTFNLIPVLTAFENVELPLLLTDLTRAERRRHVETALRLVGLGDRMAHYPKQLSGGQEQRVAVARALVTDPALLLADEPTGNLDARAADDVMRLLARLNAAAGKTIIVVTHDPRTAGFARRLVVLDKGVLEEEVRR
ncbi:MAG TPA: ABC transporter ATP-binding protein [Thermodesulfobacteriota bacterium]